VFLLIVFVVLFFLSNSHFYQHISLNALVYKKYLVIISKVINKFHILKENHFLNLRKQKNILIFL